MLILGLRMELVRNEGWSWYDNRSVYSWDGYGYCGRYRYYHLVTGSIRSLVMMIGLIVGLMWAILDWDKM